MPGRQFLLITLLFWTYVALSNVLYAHSFSVTLAATAADDLFAPWRQRVLQHLILLGPLVACYWLSLRVGWRPLWRALPLQAALALGFAAIPHWAMSLSGWSIKLATGAMPRAATVPMKLEAENAALWIASGTNFLLQYGFGLALITGFALSFARALGEYGSVVFISGNKPLVTEITSLLIITKLEQYDYAGATALAVVMLVASFFILLTINAVQWYFSRAALKGV